MIRQWTERPIQQELALCQRYFEKSFDTDVAPANNLGTGSDGCIVNPCANGGFTNSYPPCVYYKAQKRILATFHFYSAGTTTDATWDWYSAGGTGTQTAPTVQCTGLSSFLAKLNGSGTATLVSGHWTADAEL
jgi:hypothetical protein